jgi:hypothetical protein
MRETVLMEVGEASRRGLAPRGVYSGTAVTGCEPDAVGLDPVLAVPASSKQHGLTVDDIDPWELDEALASQAVCCRDALGIDRSPQVQRQRRRDSDRPPLRDDRRTTGRPRPPRRAATSSPATSSSPCASAVAWAPQASSRSADRLRSSACCRQPSGEDRPAVCFQAQRPPAWQVEEVRPRRHRSTSTSLRSSSAVSCHESVCRSCARLRSCCQSVERATGIEPA